MEEPNINFDLATVKMRLSELVSDETNPRKPVRDEPEFYEKLYNSLKQWGYKDPIIVNIRNGKNTIIGGNQRYAILCDMAKEQGFKLSQVNVSVVPMDISDAEELAMNIGLNKISGDWLSEKLKDALSSIKSADEELTKFTGFTDEEIDQIINVDMEEDLEDQHVFNTFRFMIELPKEAEDLYDIYMTTHSEDELKKAIVKILSG